MYKVNRIIKIKFSACVCMYMCVMLISYLFKIDDIWIHFEGKEVVQLHNLLYLRISITSGLVLITARIL